MTTIFDVFYIGGSTGWATAEYTIDGDKVGDARFSWRKADAIAEARSWNPHKAIRIFDRNGRIQKTVI